VFSAERVGEKERFGELTGAHQEARAVYGPWAFNIHTALPLGESGGSVANLWLLVAMLGSRSIARAEQKLCGLALPLAGLWRKVKRLYALGGCGSIPKELCNRGILLGKVGGMN
jgi:hypothetical protein